MSVFMFPGQGSQLYGMADELLDDFPIVISKVDEILGCSFKELCKNKESDDLNKTNFTQPALYVVNALSYYKTMHTGRLKPSYAIGHSLGEYNALLVADVFDFFTGLKIVMKRGELMSDARHGKMAAVLGISHKNVHDLLTNNKCKDIAIANYNSPGQTVISGEETLILKAEKLLVKYGAKVIILNVSGAFHSPLMHEAKKKFSEFLTQFDFNSPNIPVLANINTDPYTRESVSENLADQITGPVKWLSIVEKLLNKGEEEFEEVGPGNVLTKLVQSIKESILVYQ